MQFSGSSQQPSPWADSFPNHDHAHLSITSDESLLILTCLAGPGLPCQGMRKLNSDRKNRIYTIQNSLYYYLHLSIDKPLKSDQVSILNQIYYDVMFKIFNNLPNEQSLMVNKIKLLNTQYQYPYPILIPNINTCYLFHFVDYATDVMMECMQQKIIRCIHAGISDILESKSLVAHLDHNKTWQKITKNYYWPRMYSNITDYIRSYNQYQRSKSVHLWKADAKL